MVFCVKRLYLRQPIVIITILSVLALSGCGSHMPRIIILDDPLTAEEHLNLGVSYESKQEYLYAIEQYQLAAEGKLKARAELYTGNVYFSMGDIDAAESHYKLALKTNPGFAEAYNSLAWLYATEKINLHEAEKLALKAVDLSNNLFSDDRNENFRDTLNTIRTLLRE